MAVLVVLAVVVVAGAAAGLRAIDHRLDAERLALERSATVAGQLRAALDELRAATTATARAHDRLGTARAGEAGASPVPE